MAQRIHTTFALLTQLLALLPNGCLPRDTRPEPAQVFIVTDIPETLRDSQTADATLVFTTEDHWTVTIRSLHVSMGNAELSGENCNSYADADYHRTLNMLHSGPQKLSQIWGLNDCRIDYSLRVPSASDPVVGQGVAPSDLDLMTNAMVPTSTPTGMTTAQGMTVHIVGAAEKDAVTLGFDWGFSSGVRFTDCKRRVNGAIEDHLQLVGEQTTNVAIQIDPRRLFGATAPSNEAIYITDNGDAGTEPAPSNDAGDPNGSTRPVAPIALMQLFADADQVTGNANGHISMEELARVQIPADATVLSQIPGASINLAEAVRQSSLPAIFIYGDGGQCSIDIRQDGRRRRR